MRKVILIFWIASAVCQISIDEEEKWKSLSTAFENVTRHLFQLETRMFINNYGVDSNTVTWLMLRSLNKRETPFRLQNFEKSDKTILMDASAFLTFDSFDKLRDFNLKLILTNRYFKPLQLFVYCEGATFKKVDSLTQDINKKSSNIADRYIYMHEDQVGNGLLRMDYTDIIQYEYFLIDEKIFVRLMTFLWFSSEKCGKLHLEEINRFNKVTKKWESNKFSMEKLLDFHNCEIATEPNFLLEPWFYARHFNQVIITALSNHLNFRFKDIKIKPLARVADVPSSQACYDQLIEIDGNNSLLDNRLYFLTWPVDYSPVRLAAPPRGFYSEYEKLLMPFDFFTWVLIASTFVAAFSTILILYFVKRSTRDFIIGPNVTTPTLNVIQIFFGISQSVLPRRNFARFLTMMFILFCLIIRTAWQGKMYEFMQKDVAKPEVLTIEEMIEKGYTFYMNPGFEYFYAESEIAKRGIVADLDISYFFKEIFETDFNGVIETENFMEELAATRTRNRFEKRLRKEILHFKICGIILPSHHHFVGILDLKSQQLFTSGIIKHFTEDAMKFEVHAQQLKYSSADGPKVLNMIILGPGFMIWSTSLIFTLIAFSLEWLVTLKDYILSKYIFSSFFRLQRGAGH